jgi:hypothetical protein
MEKAVDDIREARKCKEEQSSIQEKDTTKNSTEPSNVKLTEKRKVYDNRKSIFTRDLNGLIKVQYSSNIILYQRGSSKHEGATLRKSKAILRR